jgi:ribosomal protein S27E
MCDTYYYSSDIDDECDDECDTYFSNSSESESAKVVPIGITTNIQKLISKSLQHTENPEDAINDICRSYNEETGFDSDTDSDTDVLSDANTKLMAIHHSRMRKVSKKKVNSNRTSELNGSSIVHPNYVVQIKGPSSCAICAICMNEHKKEDRIIRLRCRDTFHKGCYDEWSVKSYRCPKCLKVVDDSRAQREFKALDQEIEENDLSDGEETQIKCIDCENVFVEMQNPIKNKCNVCGSYNTLIN